MNGSLNMIGSLEQIEKLLSSSDTTDWIVEEIKAGFIMMEPKTKAALVNDMDESSILFDLLIGDGSFADCIECPELEETPPRIVLSPSDKVKYMAAISSKTRLETLGVLSRDKNTSVRIAISQNPKTPPHVLYEMTKDSDSTVLASLAQNNNISTEVATVLFDKEPFTHKFLASNSATPERILVLLQEH